MDARLDFSVENRGHLLNELEVGDLDLVVIGGGITGAGIALDAATRGLKVGLIEKGDFASGTSGKSTKLIHGGLRYLKHFEFGLVKEVGQERAILHRLAPHVVVPEKMILPLIKGGSMGRTMTSLGLYIYDFLAEVEGDDKRKMLDRDEMLEIEPMLPAEKLLGGSIYAEYRTDDARLTIEVLKTAYGNGAIPLNYVECEGFMEHEGQVTGVNCKDVLTGRSFEIKSGMVVNAAGPWVDEVRSMNEVVKGKRLYLTKGIHLVVPHSKLPVQHAIYFDVPGDDRMIFAIPRLGITYIGTTDTYYEEDKDNIQVGSEDINYLLNAVNLTFPLLNLTRSDIISSWAGVRPLIYEDGKSASEISRKDEIFETESGLISIAGGKLTGYRKMAERVVDLVVKKMSRKADFGKCQTESVYLTEPYFKHQRDIADFEALVAIRLKELGLPKSYAPYLVQNYGLESENIVESLAREDGVDVEKALILGELKFCLKKEMVVSPLDFMIRRTGRLYFMSETLAKMKEVVFTHYATINHYSDEQLMNWERRWDQIIDTTCHFN